MKQAWREEDQAQREARLNYVSTLGSIHQTSEAAQAAAGLTYQQARAAANRIEQDARAALRVDFNKQQASTFATETAGWLTSAPTPWHKQLASQAEAESTYRAVEQDASLLQQQAEHAAKENYLDDRETARVTLRTDRAAASAAEAFTEQQNLENGHEYGDEYYDDHDPYQNVTVDLPTGLNYDNSSNPDGVSHTLDDDPFSGQFSLSGAFGSQIGGGAYSPDDPEGSYYGEYSNYGLADQQASQVRGGTFDANNPLGALGRSDAQVNGTQTVNWGNSPRNQQTNEQPPTQIAGFDAGEAPEWQSGEFAETPPEVPNLAAAQGTEESSGNASDSSGRGQFPFTGPQLPQKPDTSDDGTAGRYAIFNDLFHDYLEITGQGDSSESYPYDIFAAWSASQQLEAIDNARRTIANEHSKTYELLHPTPEMRARTEEEERIYQAQLDWDKQWEGEDLTDPAVSAAYFYQNLIRNGQGRSASVFGVFYTLDTVGFGMTGGGAVSQNPTTIITQTRNGTAGWRTVEVARLGPGPVEVVTYPAHPRYKPSSPVHVSNAHSANSINQKTRFGGGNRNTPKTVLEGHIDILADLAEINAGRAMQLPNGDILTSSGRIYGSHTGSGSTAIFPRSGSSTINLTQAEFDIFRMMIRSGVLACPKNLIHSYESSVWVKVIAVGCWSEGVARTEAGHCDAKSAGVWPPRLLWGRRWL